MSRFLEIRGGHQLASIADKLVELEAGKAVRRKLLKAIRIASEPIVTEQRTSLAAGLPHRGGLAELLSADLRATRQVRTAGTTTGVRLIDRWPGHDVRGLESGLIRHPLWGNRDHWYAQRIKDRLLAEPVEHSKRRTQRAIISAMDDIADQIARSG